MPEDLRSSCARLVAACFPFHEQRDVWQGVLRYLDWLADLPVTRRQDRVE